MKLYDFIIENKATLDKGYKSGIVNSSTMFQFKLAQEYNKLKSVLPKMVRYQWVADENRVSVTTVRSAVKRMGVD